MTVFRYADVRGQLLADPALSIRAAGVAGLCVEQHCEYSTGCGLNIRSFFLSGQGYSLSASMAATPTSKVTMGVLIERSIMKKAKSSHRTSHCGHIAEEDDFEFRDLIRSITVTKEELSAITNMPEYSIPEVKEYLRENKPTKRSEVNTPAILRTFRSRFERGWREIAKEFAAAGILNLQPRNPHKS
jgi:hypothetical protein